MKNDINLLQKRKGKKYSAQKWATLLLGIALFAGSVYAGFMFPNNARIAARLTASEMNSEIISASGSQSNLAELTEEYAARSEQLEALTAINNARSDMGGYLEAVEKSLPASANISSLSIVGQTLGISGEAPDDDIVATFCVRLRETGKFSSVFLQNSLASPTGGTTFSIVAELPVTMDSTGVLSDVTETTEEVTP